MVEAAGCDGLATGFRHSTQHRIANGVPREAHTMFSGSHWSAINLGTRLDWNRSLVRDVKAGRSEAGVHVGVDSG
jgi:hypothetical protein